MTQVLVADDDPVNARFLSEALVLAGRGCTVARDGGAAFALARERCYGLLLLDLRMPVLGGEQLLRRLRGDPDAASRDSRAVAMSGDIEPERAAALRAAGFDAVLRKPLRLDQLEALLRNELPSPAAAETPHGERVLDDEAALRATGSESSLRGLRELFEAELPQQLALLRAAHARRDSAAQQQIAHRLLAGCRFCGAAALEAALARHRAALAGGAGADSLAALELAAQRTLAALSR